MGRLLNKFIRAQMAKFEANGLDQEMNEGRASGELYKNDTIPLCRQAAAEAVVLLKNEHQTLPIRQGEKVAVFGRCALNYFGVGYGSGGDVCRPYMRNLYEGLDELGVCYDKELYDVYAKWIAEPKNEPDEGWWGHWPMNFPEMPLRDDLVKAAAERNDLAVVVIGRAAGEDRENVLKEGSFYLTKLEKKMLKSVSTSFDRVAVVLDCGNVIDMSWTMDYDISAILYAWQGGMESGTALADVLTGKVNPSGRLTDTIAKRYEDYPSAKYFGGKVFNDYAEDIFVGYRYFETFARDKVLYPFGHGLSYTTFDMSGRLQVDGDKITATVNVKNTGSVAGKQVVQIYGRAPQGKLGKPELELMGFAKTDVLAPGDEVVISVTSDLTSLASYDDTGVTGHLSAFVLEAGEYGICLGNSSGDVTEIGKVMVEADRVVEQCEAVFAVSKETVFKRMVNRDGQMVMEDVPVTGLDLRQRIASRFPAAIERSQETPLTFDEVQKNPALLDEFIAQLSPEELFDLTKGYGPMNSPDGVAGNAGAFGGVTEDLKARKIPPVITADGPSGVRIKRICTLLPCGTALASTFNPELTEKLYQMVGAEAKHYEVDMLLAPGMNIHRNPLCGRNFEYYSEDPYLTGKMASAAVRGLQSNGISACPKHFACNNQEVRRNTNDSRVSERALREIYLKGFEIMVKEAHPRSIMTSYNKINGVWNHYNYDLTTTVLRKEWGYEGLVITDWWLQPDQSREFEGVGDDEYRIRAQVDVNMPGGNRPGPGKKLSEERLASYGKPDGITLGELQRSAKNVLKFVLEAKYL